MTATLALPLLWGQMFLKGTPDRLRVLVGWLYLLGEPNISLPSTSLLTAVRSGAIYWVKIVALFCLLGWVASWLMAAIKERKVGRGSWVDYAALVALIGGFGTLLLSVLETTGRVRVYNLGTPSTGKIGLVAGLSVVWGALILLWVENALWQAVTKLGRRGDVAVLVGLHLALAGAIGLGFLVRQGNNAMAATNATIPTLRWSDGLTLGVRLGGTFMGYVVLLRVATMVLGEVLAVRPRRVYAIAKVTVTEANRRMWAPWVVIAVFVVVLAFTHWFLQPPRPAEMGRLYVGTLSLFISLLLTVMVALLTPLSLPQDIQNQTIYTVVSKPVRRIELVWGRILGFMTIVTGLILVFGLASLAYLWQTVGSTIRATETAAVKAGRANRVPEARQLREQANQIRTRMAARVPYYGVLTFLDSKGAPHNRGIDVGQEQSMTEPRSHIEGATPATAIWTFGANLADPLVPNLILHRPVPVGEFLPADSVEGLLDRSLELKYQVIGAERQQARGDVAAAQVKDLSATITRLRAEQAKATDAFNKAKAKADDLDARAAAAEAAGQPAEAQALRRQANALHAKPVHLEMTFNVYRTTKGRIGEAVYAELEATNPLTGLSRRKIFPIREYYTNKIDVPSELLAGSRGEFRVEVRCISNTQYLGMAQSDLFLMADEGRFGVNFMKGLFGVWLQALVLTSIGVFAGTFLSWPVALLKTIAFFLGGQVAFVFLLDFTRQSLVGGGPFESLIRLLSHDNQVSDLDPTVPVVTAKTLDALVMPVMSRLVYLVPNFAALDVSNTVADGFAVSWSLLLTNALFALAYTLPFSVAGYFILKNREVAA